MSSHFDIRGAFLDQQTVLLAQLTGRTHTHPTAIGDKTELHWVDAIRAFLPQRYRVRKAFVVDASGGRSQQQDVVIYDGQYAPVLYQDGGGMYIPAEAVYAVFEVKQRVTKKNIAYAAEKVASVRRLDRTSAAIPHAGGTFDPAELKPIVGGLLATTATWKTGLGHTFATIVQGLKADSALDLGCALNCGAFELVTPDDERATALEVSDGDVSLISFMLRLFARLQAMATAPAIDIRKYGEAVWK
jgi:hypothetical protein